MNIKQIEGIGDIAYIEHGNWSVCIDSHGAHVLGLFFKEKNVLHYNSTDMEHSGIPICMPNFGPLFNNIFEHQGADFAITQHGFFRDYGYQLLNNSATSASYQLNSNPETRQRFPFDFCFIVTFSIDDSGLTAALSLTNKSNSSMPIAPGIHPYYAVAEGEDVVFETCAQAANDNNQDYADVLIEEHFEVIFESKPGVRRVRVIGKPDLHLKGHGLQKTRLTIGSNPVLTITADLTSFNRMTIWRKEADSPFICLEPAFVKNGLNDQPILIPPDETWSTVFQIGR